MLDKKERKLKFLFVLEENYPPFRVDTTVLFADEITAKGHQITWLFETDDSAVGSGWKQWQGGQARVFFTGQGGARFQRVRRYLRSFLVDLAIVPAAFRDEFDFIQVKDRFFGGVVGLIMAKITKTPFFFWLSFPYPEIYSRRLADGESKYPIVDRVRAAIMKFLLYRVICKCSDHIFVQSDQMKADLEQEGVTATKMTAVPMCISLDRIDKFKSAYVAKKSDNVVLLYLGTLAKVRKLDFLVRVLRLIQQDKKDVVLQFVGAGNLPEDEQLILNEACKHGIRESVEITGFLPWQDAWQRVLNADVCLSPYFPTPILNSTSPTKLIEYMALEKPVVANDHPDQRQVIEASGAGFCVPWDEQAFSEAIALLLENPKMAQEMTRKGAAYVRENRSYRAMGEKLEKIYYKLLGLTGQDNCGAG